MFLLGLFLFLFLLPFLGMLVFGYVTGGFEGLIAMLVIIGLFVAVACAVYGMSLMRAA
jgi:hypothetical protein